MPSAGERAHKAHEQHVHGAQGDCALRAMTDDAAFRVVAVSTTETVQKALSHQTPGVSAATFFGDLLTASILVRETMAPTHRVQAILKKQGQQGSIVADAHPSGDTRGLVSQGAKDAQFTGGEVLLQVMRHLQSGRTHQGVVAVPPGGRVSEALMVYMKTSEQVDSMVAVGCHFDGGKLKAAGGYLIQLLPGVGQAPLAFMEARLAEVAPLSEVLASGDFSPSRLLETLLAGIDHTRLGESGLRFGCWCSAERLLGALSTLPKADIDELCSSGEVLHITCDYCKKEYQLPPSNLAGLRQQS